MCVSSTAELSSGISSRVTIHGPIAPERQKFLPAVTECFWNSRTLTSMRQV